MLRCFWQANAHERSLYLVITSLVEVAVNTAYFVLFETWKGAVFFVCNLYISNYFMVDEKEGVGKFTYG